MIDIVDHATRSRMMANIRSKDTKPELIVRQFLHQHGFRYRLHRRNLPGTPDIVLDKWKTVIFVHGCFWHRHQGCFKATTPSSNVEKWRAKFEANRARDDLAIAKLLSMGWRVIVIWECGISKSTIASDLDWLPDSLKESEIPYSEWPEKQKPISSQ